MVEVLITHLPLAERRITLRLIAYWEKMRNGRDMPEQEEIIPADLHDLWENCFLVRVKDAKKSDYHYTYLGDAIKRAYFGGTLQNDDIDKLVSLAAPKMGEDFGQVLASGKPLVNEGEFCNLDNETVRYRQCILPLGKNGRVHAMLGGMRFRIFPGRP